MAAQFWSNLGSLKLVPSLMRVMPKS